jgi:hypothetical protein
MEPAVLEATRAAIREHGAGSLTVDDLTPADLERIGWSGGPTHTPAVAEALKRAEQGEVDYLAVRSPVRAAGCRTGMATAGAMSSGRARRL